MTNHFTTLAFHGAARTVTGSCMELTHTHEGNTTRVLVDCGLFQGSKTLQQLNIDPFGFDPRGVDVLLLTHAHIDHCGLIPKLTKTGFTGAIYCTEPTADILAFTLLDSAHIQESEAERLSRRNAQRGRAEVEPIYTQANAQESFEQVRTIALEQWFPIGPGLRARYWNAGHIIGSASIEVEATQPSGRPLKLLFSGDLGPDEKAFYADPDAPKGFDVVVSESTYGNRDRPDVTLSERRAALERAVQAALERGGNLLIPSFAIERTQELLLDLAILMNAGKLPRTQVFIDSPLASKATSVYHKHAHDLEGLPGGGSPFSHPAFHYVETGAQSQQLAKLSGVIILAASGMCEAGRIRHHLKNNLWRPESTVLFVGYQAQGSLGQAIQSGAKYVRIHGEEVRVKCQVHSLENYSAHADRPELARWVQERLPVHGGVFLTHGEPDAMAGLTAELVKLGIGENRVFQPTLDAVYGLAPDTAPVLLTKGRTIAEETLRHDWHNDYADMMAGMKDRLARLPDDTARAKALSQMRRILDEMGSGRP
jgi:metallo-beta-lactamase family protein